MYMIIECPCCHKGLWPNMEVIEFKDVGHAPALMDAEQVEVIKTWLMTFL